METQLFGPASGATDCRAAMGFDNMQLTRPVKEAQNLLQRVVSRALDGA